MQIDPEKYKAVLIEFLRNLQKLEREMIVRGFVIELLKEAYWIDPSAVDAILQAARENPALKVIEQKYEERILAYSLAVDQAALDQALAEFLKSWKPSGPIH